MADVVGKMTGRFSFADDHTANTPSRRDGLSLEDEMRRRHDGVCFIHKLANVLKIKALCINTAVVYLHRYFMFKSLAKSDIYAIATCCLFLAAKCEEQPVRSEVMIKASWACHPDHHLEVKSINDLRDLALPGKIFQKQFDQLIYNENMLLMVLGFEVAVEHPHTVILKAFRDKLFDRDFGRVACDIATDFYHNSTLCLQYAYQPAFFACICIYLAARCLQSPIIANKSWCSQFDKSMIGKEMAVVKTALRTRRLISMDKYEQKMEQPKKRPHPNQSPDSGFSSPDNSKSPPSEAEADPAPPKKRQSIDVKITSGLRVTISNSRSTTDHQPVSLTRLLMEKQKQKQQFTRSVSRSLVKEEANTHCD